MGHGTHLCFVADIHDIHIAHLSRPAQDVQIRTVVFEDVTLLYTLDLYVRPAEDGVAHAAVCDSARNAAKVEALRRGGLVGTVEQFGKRKPADRRVFIAQRNKQVFDLLVAFRRLQIRVARVRFLRILQFQRRRERRRAVGELPNRKPREHKQHECRRDGHIPRDMPFFRLHGFACHVFCNALGRETFGQGYCGLGFYAI